MAKPQDFETVKHELQQKSSKELLTILSLHQHDYSPELITTVKDELLKRGISNEEVDKANNSYFVAIEKDQSSWSKSKKKIFRYAFIGLGIAVSGAIKQSCNSDIKRDKWSDMTIGIHKIADSLFSDRDTANREKWAGCVIDKYKEHFPGGYYTIPKDSIAPVSRRYGYECGVGINQAETKNWTPEFTATFRNLLMKTKLLKVIEPEYQDRFCDCYIEQLKTKYPNGMPMPVPDGVQDTITITCANQIKK